MVRKWREGSGERDDRRWWRMELCSMERVKSERLEKNGKY